MKNVSNGATHQHMITSGIGVANYFLRDEGKFQVRYRHGIREFDTLISAYLFYNPLEIEASIWDMTIEPILIESKTIVHTP